MTLTEYEVRALLDRRSEAIWARDIDGLISCYSPDIVYFDIVPPLQYVGLPVDLETGSVPMNLVP